MLQKIIIPIILIFISIKATAQQVMGTVVEIDENKKEIPVTGANVYFVGTTTGTSTDESGKFILNEPEVKTGKIVISFIGYVNDTVKAEGAGIKVILKKSIQLKPVEITQKRDETFISSMKTIKTETLTTSELKKNACCNLSESFESNPTVDVSFSDAVTGAKQIQLLGLSGTYVQMLTDVLPTVRGLGSTFGLSYIPGTWVDAININKGTGSVANGYESITGQIDVELKKPEESEKVYLNLYGNNEGRAEANLNLVQKVNNKWSTMLLLHGNTLQNKMDDNNDNFIDQPLNDQYAIMNRWKFDSQRRVESMFGIKYLYDNRTGGDIHFNPDLDKLTGRYYGLGINTKRTEAFMKTSYGFPTKEYQSVGLQVSAINHDQNSYFGLKKYEGNEKSLYTNLLMQSIIGSTQHKFRTGISFMLDKYEERLDSLQLNRYEKIPGAFFEYTYDDFKKLAVVIGVRGDYHSDYNFIFTPRLHAKYSLSESSTLRASAGNGFHIANIFAENSSILASSRNLIILETLKPERTWNYGINFTHCFLIKGHEGTFSTDIYRTDFTDQVICDLYSQPGAALFYNLHGKSYSNSFQAELKYEFVSNLTAKIAYKINDVQSTYNGELREKPLNPKQRGLLNLAYETNNSHWKFDFTAQWIGKQKLPSLLIDNHHPDDHVIIRNDSPSYIRLLGQISYLTGKWEFYMGGENLNDYMQHDPVIAPDQPFSKYFDTSGVWGPVTGRMIYAGLRFAVK
ncbi:MAG TPA: TonB-dependent receptor [Bacteroidia bacterium]|nr:TonB-dependent receptor [Bacteroidia bacterium]